MFWIIEYVNWHLGSLQDKVMFNQLETKGIELATIKYHTDGMAIERSSEYDGVLLHLYAAKSTGYFS